MPLVMAILVPHPTDRDVTAVPMTDKAARLVGQNIAKKRVETLVLLQSRPFAPTDPFTPPASDPQAVNVLGLDKSSAAGFVFENEVGFLDELTTHARPAGWAIKRLPQIEFDPSSAAAMSWIGLVDPAPKLVVATLPYQNPPKLVDFGLLLGGVAKKYSTNVAIVAIANLANRLSGQSQTPEAKKFDETFKQSIEQNKLESVINYDLSALEAAGEEAARPVSVLYGAARASQLKKVALESYEAPSTTGYSIVTWQ